MALVTAASQGIGQAIAAALAAEGARVAVSSRSAERIEAAAAQIGAEPFVHDTLDLDAAPALIEAVSERLGPPDVLVTNSGGPAGGEPLGFGRDDWESAYRELVLAPMELVAAVLPAMRERGFGRIVNVSSTTVREPNPALMLSNSHRAATLAAFRTLAGDLASDGITLNSLLPGRIATARLAELYGSLEQAEQTAAEEVPAGRLGRPSEMGAAAAFLCSEQAGYITGAALLVDGGLTRAV